MGAAIYSAEHRRMIPRRKQVERAPVVLVVDDENALLDMVQEILTDEGFTVLTANDGRGALSLATHARPDLVITDLMMPGMNGRALREHLARDPLTARTPVVLMSAAYPDFVRKRSSAIATSTHNWSGKARTIRTGPTS